MSTEKEIEEAVALKVKEESIALGATYTTVLTCDWVCSIILDNIEAFMKSPLCKGKMKQIANRLMGKRVMFEAMMNDISVREGEMYWDMCDNFESCLKMDLFKLYNAVHFELTKKKVPDADIRAKVEIVRAMAAISCLINDSANAIVRKLKTLRVDISYLRQTTIAATAKSLSELLMRDYASRINLNENTSVVAGVNKIINKICHTDLVERSYKSVFDNEDKEDDEP